MNQITEVDEKTGLKYTLTKYDNFLNYMPDEFAQARTAVFSGTWNEWIF